MRIYKLIVTSLLLWCCFGQLTEYLVEKLFKVCQQDQQNTISLYQCEDEIIKNDKKNNNYRQSYDYAIETTYMMITFDQDNDGRLNKKQVWNMASKISDVSERQMQQTVKQYKKNNPKQFQRKKQQIPIQQSGSEL